MVLNPGVYISVTNDTDLGVTNDGKIIVSHRSPNHNEEIVLGKATKQKIEILISNLERLKIHCE